MSKLMMLSLTRNVCNIQSLSMIRRHISAQIIDKTKLIDSHGRRHRYLRISLTEKCNLRCKYCMPECGVPLTKRSDLLTSAEIQRIAEVCVRLGGVDKIRLTGGEPSIRSDILDVVGNLSSIEGLRTLGMTTNGITTARIAASLKSSGLDIINISLDTLDASKYASLTRRKGLSKVLRSIDACLEAGFDTVKINCVLMKGFNDNEIIDFVNFTKDKPLDIRFIEYMPFDGNAWRSEKMMPYKEIVTLLQTTYGQSLVKLSDPANHTAKAWKINNYKGKIGFITSMSENFCSGCDRIRLTADGNLKVCLFGNTEVSLRDHLRGGATDTEIIDVINQSLKKKAWKHAGMETIAKSKNRPMILIGNTTFLLHQPVHNYSQIRLYSNYYDDYANIFAKYTNTKEAKDNEHKPDAHRHQENTTTNTSTNLTTTDTTASREWTQPPHNGSITATTGQVELTHWTVDGARMVNVGDKVATRRTAEAEGHVIICPAVRELLTRGGGKGDALVVAQVAGIQASKRTSSLIPLCHQVSLTACEVHLTVHHDRVYVHSNVTTTAQQTGVEMEALVAVSVACLTVYDMLKSASKAMSIEGVRLLSKTGGKSDYKH